MADIFRRTDLGDREFLSLSVRRAVAQQARDAGDGAGGSATATWGSISGTITNQLDLNQVLKDKETMDFFLDN